MPPSAEPEVTIPVTRPRLSSYQRPERVCDGTYRKQYPVPTEKITSILKKIIAEMYYLFSKSCIITK